MKIYSLLLVLIMSLSVLGQKIHHTVSMPEPETHYFHIKTVLSNFKDKKLVLTMPVWSPGSYLIREYPNNVNLVRAKDENGNSLSVRKVRKNQWEIDKGKAKEVIVEYEYYAFDLSVRTSFLDNTHGYFNGVNIFTYPEGYMNLGGKLTVVPHSSFKTISIPLQEEREGFASDSGSKTYIFSDFDELADAPCEVGNQEVFTFDASGVHHTVAMYGYGNYDVEKLKVDMAKIVEASTEVFGENPNKNYLFIIHNVIDGSGGLEHVNSTTLSVNRFTYSGDKYLGFLSLVAHEYFHVWNVKRLRPSELVKYDYSNENYTDWLWVMEGFTSYYDKLILRRAGFYSEEEYMNKFIGTLNWIEGSVGNRVQPVADASFDAWIKAYIPNENSGNTTISYYSKGGIIAGVFDAMIIRNSDGKLSLDDFMTKLYVEFYKKKNVGINLQNFKSTLEEFTGQKMDDFFAKYIYGVETIPYEDYFKPLGVNMKRSDYGTLSFGARFKDSGGKLVISSLDAGSPAEKAGLSVNDEIIAMNGMRVDFDLFDNLIGSLDEGDSFNLIIARDLFLKTVDVKLDYTYKWKYNFTGKPNGLGKFWLRGR